MAVFTFVCHLKKKTWTAKQHACDSGIEGSATSTFDLQRQLTKLAVEAGGSGSVSSSFSFITPSSAVYQVIIGSGGGGAFLGGGGGAPSAGGAAAPAAVEEEKKEEKKEEEESDEDMGFSLFD